MEGPHRAPGPAIREPLVRDECKTQRNPTGRNGRRACWLRFAARSESTPVPESSSIVRRATASYSPNCTMTWRDSRPVSAAPAGEDPGPAWVNAAHRDHDTWRAGSPRSPTEPAGGRYRRPERPPADQTVERGGSGALRRRPFGFGPRAVADPCHGPRPGRAGLPAPARGERRYLRGSASAGTADVVVREASTGIATYGGRLQHRG